MTGETRVIYRSSADEVWFYVACKPLSYNTWELPIPQKHREYKQTLIDACEGLPCVHGRVAVFVTFYWRKIHRRDLDNFIKPVLDGFQDHIFDNDRNIYALDIKKKMGRLAKQRNGIEVRVLPIDQVQIETGSLTNPQRLTLSSLPPSTNTHYLRNKGKKICLSPAAKKYIKLIQNRGAKRGRIHGPVEMLCRIIMTSPTRRDVDNFLKVILDGIKNTLIDDDTQLYHIVIYKTKCDLKEQQKMSLLLTAI